MVYIEKASNLELILTVENRLTVEIETSLNNPNNISQIT